MLSPARNHPSYWAFLGHRLSGIGLALFLPAHFLVLGTALEGAAALDAALAYTELAPVKVAEGALVTLLALHLLFGLRLLWFELRAGAGPAAHRAWVVPCAGTAVVLGGAFLLLAY